MSDNRNQEPGQDSAPKIESSSVPLLCHKRSVEQVDIVDALGEREFDIIIWGATGYTGRLACEYMIKQTNRIRAETGKTIKWAIGGRRKNALDNLSSTLKKDHSMMESIRTVVASIDNYHSLTAMTSRCKVLASFVGPYALYGEPVIKACISTRTDYADATAELLWIQQMSKLYDADAKKNQVKIIVCCGFDFVPNDMMMLQAQRLMEDPAYGKWSKFPREVVHIFNQSTSQTSGGTAYSGLNMLKKLSFKESVDMFVDPYAICSEKSKSQIDEVPRDLNSFQILPYYAPETKTYCTPFVMSSLMHKFIHWSNEIQGHPWGINVIYRGGEGYTNGVWAFWKALFLWIQFLLAVILSKLPPLWSLVTFIPGDGPPIDKSKAYMESNMVARYPTLTTKENSLSLDPEKTIHIKWRLDGYEAYGAAAIFVIEGCLTLARVENQEKLPKRYGMLSPSAALGDEYLERLKRSELKWSVE